MSSIIEKIYYGRMFPSEQIVPRCDEYRDENRKVAKLMSELSKKLDADDREKLEALYDSMMITQSIMCLETYKAGFSSGLVLMKEAQQEADSPKPECIPS